MTRINIDIDDNFLKKFNIFKLQNADEIEAEFGRADQATAFQYILEKYLEGITVKLGEELDKKVSIFMIQKNFKTKAEAIEQIVKEKFPNVKKENDERYWKYRDAIYPQLDWIRQKIKESKDGFIRMRIKDIAESMGEAFVKKNPTSIHWGLKYALFHQGIFVETRRHKDNNKLLIMRFRTEKDKLPSSLAELDDDNNKDDNNKDDNNKDDIDKDDIDKDKIEEE